MIQSENRQFLADGDPYGNRTRVSAVKEFKVMESTARPRVAPSFPPLHINGLVMRGDVA